MKRPREFDLLRYVTAAALGTIGMTLVANLGPLLGVRPTADGLVVCFLATFVIALDASR